MVCESCRKKAARFHTSVAGQSKSEAKAEAARINGRRGGRPKKNTVINTIVKE